MNLVKPADGRGFMTNQEQWEKLYNRFEPEDVAIRAEWRAERPKSPVDSIIKEIKRPLGLPKFLLLGSIGTGKSTELRRIADSPGPRRFKIFLDLHEHFHKVLGDVNALSRVQPWEVLILVGLAIWKAGSQYGYLQADAYKNLEKAVQEIASEASPEKPPTINLPKLAAALAVGVGGAAGAVMGPAGMVAGSVVATAVADGLVEFLKGAVDSVSWDFPLGTSDKKQLGDQDEKTQTLLHAVNSMLSKLQEQAGQILLIVDGLDRLQDRTVIENFFVRSSLLGNVNCRMVMAGPLLLRREGIASTVRIFKVKVLAEVPVLNQDDPWEYGEGVSFFRDLYQRRASDLSVRFPVSLIDKLAYYSGGRVRDFVILVRGTVALGYDDSADEATESMVENSIDELRRTLELGLRTGHINLLQQIANDPKHRLPDDIGEGMDRVDNLLNRFCLLPYPNESEWYFPHPLLTRNLIRRGLTD